MEPAMFPKAASTAAEGSAISRDWARTQCDVRTLDDGTFCTDWWRGFDFFYFFFLGTGTNYSRNRKKKPPDKGQETKDKRQVQQRLVLQPAHTAVSTTQRPKARRLTRHSPTPSTTMGVGRASMKKTKKSKEEDRHEGQKK